MKTGNWDTRTKKIAELGHGKVEQITLPINYYMGEKE